MFCGEEGEQEIEKVVDGWPASGHLCPRLVLFAGDVRCLSSGSPPENGHSMALVESRNFPKLLPAQAAALLKQLGKRAGHPIRHRCFPQMNVCVAFSL